MFDWKEFFRTAQYMNQNVEDFPNKEACYRTVISRAYYAAFRLSQNYIKDKHNRSWSNNEHQEVPRYLQTKKHDHALVKAGSQLIRLRQDRQKADYYDYLGIESPSLKARKSLKLAEDIIEKIEALLSSAH